MRAGGGENPEKWGVLALASVGELIDSFEAAETIGDLQVKMQRAIEMFGFSAFNFFDAGKPHLSNPYYFGTTGVAWENEYKSNNFVLYDPTLSLARRKNTPHRGIADR